MGVIRRLRKNDSSRGASTPTWPLITVSPFNDVVRDARRTTWRSKPRVEPGGHVSTMPHSLGKRYSPLSHIYRPKTTRLPSTNYHLEMSNNLIEIVEKTIPIFHRKSFLKN